jgi:hypothetical protein
MNTVRFGAVLGGDRRAGFDAIAEKIKAKAGEQGLKVVENGVTYGPTEMDRYVHLYIGRDAERHEAYLKALHEHKETEASLQRKAQRVNGHKPDLEKDFEGNRQKWQKAMDRYQAKVDAWLQEHVKPFTHKFSYYIENRPNMIVSTDLDALEQALDTDAINLAEDGVFQFGHPLS